MREIGIWVLVILAILVVGFGLAWIVQGENFILYKYWAPKQAAVERQVFQQTPSYQQGTVGELYNMMFEYNKTTDPKAKEAMASIILHRANEYAGTGNKLPDDLDQFVSGLRAQASAPPTPASTDSKY